MFSSIKRKFKNFIANLMVETIKKSPADKLRQMMHKSVEEQKRKFNLGNPVTSLQGAIDVTDVVDETLLPKLCREVYFYANVKEDKYYLIDKQTHIVVAYGNLDGKTPSETINKDLEGFCYYYNMTIAFVMNDVQQLNEYFDSPIKLRALKEEIISVGWRLNIGNSSTVIKEHSEVG